MNAGDVMVFDGTWFDAPNGCFAYALCNGDGAGNEIHQADYDCPECDISDSDSDGAAALAATAGVLVVAALAFVGA